jgi:catechol 2,3-dioxygenase
LRERAEANGAELVDAPAGFDSNGFWLRDPAGLLVEVKVAPKSSPARKTAGTWSSSPEGVAGSPLRQNAPVVRPRRLSHVLVFTTDIDEAIDFYTGNLGLRLSDRSDLVAFLHAIHGSDHHILAFAQSTAAGMHHCSWDMSSIDDIGLGAMSMAGKGHVKGWGLGRHVLGSNYFHYVQDPWGSFAEYSCDIDYIPATRPGNQVLGSQVSRARRFVLSVGSRAARRFHSQSRGLTPGGNAASTVFRMGARASATLRLELDRATTMRRPAMRWRAL